LVAGVNGQGNSNKQLNYPMDLCIEKNNEGNIVGLFVADTMNHRVLHVKSFVREI